MNDEDEATEATIPGICGVAGIAGIGICIIFANSSVTSLNASGEGTTEDTEDGGGVTNAGDGDAAR